VLVELQVVCPSWSHWTEKLPELSAAAGVEPEWKGYTLLKYQSPSGSEVTLASPKLYQCFCTSIKCS
jgi:hypothetical protein